MPGAPPIGIRPPPLPERYEVSVRLGEGGMGQVWAARDLVLDEPVAIKILRTQVAGRRTFLLRFQREIALQARYPHPNLVPLHDAGELPDGRPFVAMALAELGSLSRFLPKGLPWERALPLIDQLLGALASLHARGVIHLDLKPENVLLRGGPSGQLHVWLADLGVARLMAARETLRRGAVGTPAYMAPEQRQGQVAELDRRTDIYAVGVLLAQLVGAHAVPRGLPDLIRSMVHRDKLCRPSLAADVRLALKSLGPAALPLPVLPLEALRNAAPTWVTDMAESCAPQPSSLEDEGEWPPWPRQAPPFPPPFPPEEEPGQGSLRASLSLYAHREIPMVGRDRELARLWAMLRSARRSGQPMVALLTGEAGAGKTRLAESLMRILEQGGWAEHLPVSYQEASGGAPLDGAARASGLHGMALHLLRPWGETPQQMQHRLRHWFQREMPGLPSNALAALATEHCHDENDQDESDLALWHSQLLHWTLHARCWRGVTCLLIENAHLARGTGEGLDIPHRLLNLAALGQPAPVLTICTLSSEAIATDPELRRRLEILQEAGAGRIDLPRLDRAQIRALLNRSIDLTPDLRETVVKRCEGNPLLARQLISSWAEQDMLVEVGDLFYALKPGLDPAEAIPNDARTLFLQRALRAASRVRDSHGFMEALFLLALTGREIPEDMAQILAGPQMDALKASGLVVISHGRARFDHQLSHAVLREAASRRQERRLLHRRVAEAWTAYCTRTGRDVAVPRAEALLEAGRPDQAFEPLAQATVLAGRGAEAARLGETALRALSEARLSDRSVGAAEVLAATAAATASGGQLQRAAQLARRALQASREPAVRVRAGLTLGQIFATQGSWPRARKQLHAAELEARGARDPLLLEEVLLVLGAADLQFVDLELSLSSHEEALVLAERRDAPERRAQLLRLSGRTRQLAGQPATALAMCQLALDICTHCGTPAQLARCHSVLGQVELGQGRAEEGRGHLEAASRMLQSAEVEIWSHEMQWAQGEVHRRLGQLSEARRSLRIATQWAEARRMPMEALRAQLALMSVELSLGDGPAGLTASERALALAKDPIGVRHKQALSLTGKALALAILGRRGAALGTLEALCPQAGDWAADPDLAGNLDALATLAARKGWRALLHCAAPLARGQWSLLGNQQAVERVQAWSP